MTHSAAGAHDKAPEVLRVDLAGTLDSVDPAVAYFILSWQLEFATCAKLVNYPDGPWGPAQQPEPEIANGPPTVSADGKTYTFKLHADFRFSSQAKEEVTAESFVRALERSLAPGADSPVIAFVQDIVGAAEFHAGQASSISGFTATKKHELTIRLVRPAADLLARLAMPFFSPVPSDAPPVDADAVVSSAGPYYVESFDREGTTVARVNPNYHGKRPHLFDEIVYRANVSPDQSEAAIKAGTVDYAADELPGADYAALDAAYGPGSPAAQAGHQQFFVNPQLATRYVVFNVARPLFASVELRKAVNFALDRPAMVNALGAFGHTPTDQILPPGMPGFQSYQLYPLGGPDLAAAQALATASGKVPATAVLYAPDRPPAHLLAQIVKDNLAAIGIDVQPQFFPPPLEFFGRLATPGEPWDLALAGWSADYADPWDFIDVLLNGKNRPGAGGSDNNYGSFNDATFNQRMDDASALQPPARYSAYAALDHDLMADAAPWGPWGNINSRDFFSARVGGQAFNPLFGMDLAALRLR
jgi:peptide/nickel transport system substrate-binding protein